MFNARRPTPDAHPRELNRLDVLRGLKVATWEASFATVWATLTGGAYLTGFALWLGAGEGVIGIITAIPTFAGLIQLVSSYFGERLSSRKTFTAIFATLGRLLWLPLLLLPFMLGRERSLYPFLLLFALSYVLINVPTPAYLSWMSDLVPADHRGRYFARRNMIAGFAGMLIGLPAAWFLDVATRKHPWEAQGFGTLFGVGVLAAVCSFVCLMRQPEPLRRILPPSDDAPRGLAGVLAYYRAPFADENFRRLIAFNTLLAFGQFFAAPFFTVWSLQHLQLNYVQLQIFATLTSLASLGSMVLWGYLADKFGNKPLLVIGVFGTFTLPLYWMLTQKDAPGMMLFLVTMVSVTGGLFWAGVGLAQFNLLIRLSPPEKTPVYVATMAAVTGLSGGIAPLLGSALMSALSGWHGKFLGIPFANFHVTFFVAAVLRLMSLLLLRRVTDGHSVSTRDVLHQIGRSNPRSWRHIRRLQQGGGEEERLRAMEVLGETRTLLASNELIAALNDPSFAVREEAARALGEIGDSGATDALLRVLSDPAAGIAETAVIALGRIGDRRAVPALIARVRADTLTVARRERFAAMDALGHLGGEDAAAALREIFSEAADEEIAEAATSALAEIGDTQSVPLFALCLRAELTPLPLRLALVRALGNLPTSAEAAEPLLDALASASDDPALLSALADALAKQQADGAILPLLERLPILDSPLARRQIASALGTLLGEGELLYGLLSQEAFARDASVSRLLQDAQKRLRDDTLSAQFTSALEHYVGGEYAVFVRDIAALQPHLPETDETARAVLEALAQQAQAHADLPTECALLAVAALHHLI